MCVLDYHCELVYFVFFSNTLNTSIGIPSLDPGKLLDGETGCNSEINLLRGKSWVNFGRACKPMCRPHSWVAMTFSISGCQWCSGWR